MMEMGVHGREEVSGEERGKNNEKVDHEKKKKVCLEMRPWMGISLIEGYTASLLIS